MNEAEFSAKDPDEIIDLTFRFGRLLGADTIVSAATSVEVATGADGDAIAILDGLPTIAGTDVTQRVTGGLDGVTYELRMTVTTGTGRRFVRAGRLPIRRA